MTDSKTVEPQAEVDSGEEFVPADDRIIAKAFWLSLGVMAVFAVPAATIMFLLMRPKPTPVIEPVNVKPAQPRVVEGEVSIPTITFTDITEAAGIDFVAENGAVGEKLLPETMGCGAAFFDLDNDGDQDLLFVNATTWDRVPGVMPDAKAPEGRGPTAGLYRNDGRGNFTNITAGSGLDVGIYGQGVACGDVDGDGFTDVFITAVGRNHLFRNLGDGRFEDVTDRAGVAGNDSNPLKWSTSAAFADLDQDGDLDLVVCNYVAWSREADFQVNYTLTGIGRAYGPPTNFPGETCLLYRNGGEGVFENVTVSAGMNVKDATDERPSAKALGVVPIDLDGDGWLDLVIANDTVRKFVFLNQKDGTFKEVGADTGVAFDREGAATGAMGLDVANYLNNHELAIVVGNFANQMSSLYITQGRPMRFSDAAITEGIGPATRLSLTFGVFFFDADLDGRLDILHANGHVENEINTVQESQHYEQPGQLFWNAGSDHRTCFVEVPKDRTGDLSRPIVGRGAAYGDIDGDGDLDVVLTQPKGRPMLLRNDQVINHHWLRVKLAGRKGASESIGAKIVLKAEGLEQTRFVMPSRSYLSQMELVQTFGLGDVSKVDSVVVIWPNGVTRTVESPDVDRVLFIEQGG